MFHGATLTSSSIFSCISSSSSSCCAKMNFSPYPASYTQVQKFCKANNSYGILSQTFNLCSAAIILKKAQHCSGETIARISSSDGNRNSGLITHQFESIPVLLKSAHCFKRFRILLSECAGKAFLISSIFILRGLSRLFQNNR